MWSKVKDLLVGSVPHIASRSKHYLENVCGMYTILTIALAMESLQING